MQNDIGTEVKNLVTKDLILGNHLVDLIHAAIVFGIVFLILTAIKIFFTSKYKQARAKALERFNYKLIIFYFLKKLNPILIFIFALYPAIIDLEMPKHIDQFARFTFILAIFAQLLIWANSAVNLYSEKYIQKSVKKDPTSITAVHIFTGIGKLVVFTLLFLIMLGQMGFNITTLLAGLGVGGIAVAFALQNILSDVFGSLAIILDKPFKVGDTVKMNNFSGRIEKVGLKTTRLRSVDGELLVFSNSELLKMVIQNFGDIRERRRTLILGVAYETPYEKIKKVPDLIRQAVFSQAGTSVEGIFCKEFADSSINFEVRYFVSELNSGNFQQAQHNINMEILKLFNEDGISFAYPTRTVYTKSL